MQRTVNYDLCQYEGSDKTSYLINYNGDMLKIDTAIKGAKDAADNAQSKANTADGKADANAASISTLDTQINGAGGVAADVSSLQGSVNTINSLIGSGEPTTQDKTLIGAINELAAEMPSPTTQLPASSVSYVNTTSGLTADDVQEAIDEVVSMLPQGEVDADDVDYDNTQSGLTATNVQAAIDEIAGHSGGVGDILWTNSNPTASFATQTIAIDLTNYDAVKVVATLYDTQDYNISAEAMKGESGVIQSTSGSTGFYAGVPAFVARSFEVNANGVEFTGGTMYSMASSGTQFAATDICCIPKYIIGIKYNH